MEEKKQWRRQDAAALRAQCDAYFDACDAAGRRYTRPGLFVALDLTEETAQAWLEDDSKKYAPLAAELRRGLLRIVDALEQRDDNRSLFLLKQPCYGGYRDKPTEDSSGTMEVRVSFQGAGDTYGS